MSALESMTVGIVVEQRKMDNPWQDYSWAPISVIPGIASIRSFTLLPSQINIGQIKSLGDKELSWTSLRDHSFFLFLLNLVVGYEPRLFI